MLEELRWKTSVSASALHAARSASSGLAFADAALAATLGPAVNALLAAIDAADWPCESLLKQLTAMASEYEDNRAMVERAVARLYLPQRDRATTIRVVSAIGDLEAALAEAQPTLAEELKVRVAPLREQWEARGPGMLQEIARLTEQQLVPTAAEVVIVAPYVGGDGIVHPGHNRITLEGVLFHPVPSLPESVRMAWLIVQLNGELPRYADLLPRASGERTIAAAMAPAALAAAQEVELVMCDEATLASAYEAWGVSAQLPSDAAQRVWHWWNAWLDRPVAWPVALAALDQILAS